MIIQGDLDCSVIDLGLEMYLLIMCFFGRGEGETLRWNVGLHFAWFYTQHFPKQKWHIKKYQIKLGKSKGISHFRHLWHISTRSGNLL